MKLRAAFATSLTKQQQQALCYFHRNFCTAFLFCRSFVLVTCLGWRTDRGTGRWAHDFWEFQLAHEKKTHTHKRNKKAKKKQKGNWEAGRVFFFFFFFSLFWFSHSGNQCFFFFLFFFLHFFDIENLAKAHQKIAKLIPNLH
jgi:hypothetical protein